jgi:tetratricopeptide (TPR) repeat protein
MPHILGECPSEPIEALVNRRGLLIYTSIILASVVLAHLCSLASGETTEQARKHYMKAQHQVDEHRWDAAITEFATAYDLCKDPTFLFNMAEAHRHLGNARQAIDLYQRYLIKVPKCAEHAMIERRIQLLQKQLIGEDRAAKLATM